MIARLVALDGPGEIVLDREFLLVGRDVFCNAQLTSPRVSRLHCSLFRLVHGVLVQDLESTNGIRINGRRVHQGMLRPGDVLEIADFRFHLQLYPPENEDDAGEGRPTGRRQVSESTDTAA